MGVGKHLLIAIWGGLVLILLVQAQDQLGFISLDCGLPTNTSYIEPTTTLRFTSDDAYINSGVSKSLSSNYQGLLQRQYHHVRSFPLGQRNCYNIDVKSGTKYLMQASFLYGNYDELRKLPKFDLYFGDSLWTTVEFTDESTNTIIETIYVPSNNEIQICLVNTNNGTPFISSLEFRPLPSESYQFHEKSLLLYKRLDLGSTTPKINRFPDDIYDRFWVPFNSEKWTSISTTLKIGSDATDYFQPGSVVMGTSAIQIDINKSMEIEWESEEENTKYHVCMHFAELENLQPNQTRGFNITYNDIFMYGPFNPHYLSTTTICTTKSVPQEQTKTHVFSLVPFENSTLPPILNAMEIYSVIEFSELTSDQKDVDAMKNIKSTYGIVKDWEGDPCVPRACPWEGLDCTKNNESSPRIVSLNLSSSGLTGKISSFISNLEMIQTLDLSNNNLTGNIPTFLSQLSKLKVLKLENNQLTGPVPSELIKKVNDDSLELSVEGNPHLDACLSESCANNESKKNNVVIPIVATVVGLVAIAAIATIIFCTVKLKKKRKNEAIVLQVDQEKTKHLYGDLLEIKRRRFTYKEVLKMTNNFERNLGEGGYGIVYYGFIDGVQVAVKFLSRASRQGYQQFQAEVTPLLRIYHKNLTNLVGYLSEGNKFGLIYEFMANGNFEEYLSEKNSHVLNWKDRLQIAMDAAQGLEYLHDGCIKPIIHRDVKTRNILLTENLQGKLGDYGLSKSFPTEDNNLVIRTMNAGSKSIGYLDPEFFMSPWLTKKTDVYSFGVTLLEIISCRPVISRKEENVHISQWVNSLVAEENIYDIIDKRLDRNYDINSVWKAVEIAINCVSENSARRPTMNQVVAELKNCLAIELERTSENRALISKNPINTLSVVMD